MGSGDDPTGSGEQRAPTPQPAPDVLRPPAGDAPAPWTQPQASGDRPEASGLLPVGSGISVAPQGPGSKGSGNPTGSGCPMRSGHPRGSGHPSPLRVVAGAQAVHHVFPWACGEWVSRQWRPRRATPHATFAVASSSACRIARLTDQPTHPRSARPTDPTDMDRNPAGAPLKVGCRQATPPEDVVEEAPDRLLGRLRIRPAVTGKVDGESPADGSQALVLI